MGLSPGGACKGRRLCAAGCRWRVWWREAAGGSTDVLARVLAEAMTRDLGQQVIVENLGGAGGTIGTSRVTRAQADLVGEGLGGKAGRCQRGGEKVPYRGTGPALQDLAAGNVDVICDQPVATGPHIQAGMPKGYARATRGR